MENLIRMIGVEKNDDGTFCVFDIIEPLPRYSAWAFRRLYREAKAKDGYVLVGRSGKPSDTFRHIA